MTRAALVNPSDEVVLVVANGDVDAQTKAGYRWMPCPAVARPAYDPMTETVDGPTYAVGASAVTEVWTKRNLTAQEIAAVKDAIVGSLDGNQALLIKVLWTLHNRVRVLEGLSEHTRAQFRNALKAML